MFVSIYNHLTSTTTMFSRAFKSFKIFFCNKFLVGIDRSSRRKLSNLYSVSPGVGKERKELRTLSQRTFKAFTKSFQSSLT